MRRNLFLALAILLASVGSGQGDNWPQWRGPALNGISAETGLPTTWNADTNVTWKLDLPAWSGATPIIWDDTVFLNVGDGTDVSLWAIDRASGRRRWARKLSGNDHRERKQNMSSPSPVTDGTHVWVMTGTGFLTAFDFEGNEKWKRDIQADYGRFGLNWGYGSSPLLYDGALFVQVLHGMKTDDTPYMLRIDAATGETMWRVERPTDARRESPDSYATPALLQYDGITEIVLTGGDVVTGHDPDTGEELWRSDGLNPEDNGAYRIVASPVVMDKVIYAPTRERPLLALRAGGRGDITATHRMWEFHDGPDVPTPVTDGRYFYSVRDNGVVFCLDAKTGERIYGPVRLAVGTYSSSLVLADGKIYITSEDGLTSVFKAGPEFELLAENDLGDYTLSSPAVSDGQIFIRTASGLYAIGERRVD
ncbi:MAG TPA: PQQ-binding-like beta-propeller repeat protein [Acidobacteriota bacterium]|nr:PQQ-binding-like beta-propeller repeat protein [Acidobacteriota bacterium]